jgi:biopolymer transport protein ExbB
MHMIRSFTRTSGLTRTIGRWLLCATLVAGGLHLVRPALAEEAPANGEAPKRIVIEESFFDEIKKGGWVMIPIGLCSTALIWLLVDLWMRTAAKKLAPEAQVAGTKDLFRMGDYVGAYQHCKNNPSAFSDTVRVGLSFLGDGQSATEEALISELAKVNSQIQTRINYLSVIGVTTPMIGLVGTVTGMIKAFKTLGADGIGDPSKLAAAIGEVLVATASGLFIAIPAFMFFYFMRNKLQGSMHHLQEIVTSLFRKMPYEHLKDCHVGEEEFYAATPNWVGEEQAAVAA